MTKIIIVTVFALLISVACNAQQTGRMETDRPDQTECPFIVKKGWIQSEWGMNVEQDGELSSLLHPTILWKYGASKRFELRLITTFTTEETPVIIPNGSEMLTGLVPVQIGGKLALWEEKGLLPKTSFIFHVAPSKLGSKKFHTQQWAPNFRFTMQHTLSENIGLGYNVGAEWDGFSKTTSWIYTIAPGFNLGKKWYGYIEAFGALSKGSPPQHAVDGGLACYFSENTKLDFSTGFGLSKAATDWYAAIGISFRFATKRK
ncbi:MAG TPA: transporter [Chitinophagaceae bacterium]|jgi:hypothetical protein|nr:transporter [Chitinophagaceae bacterium]HNJ56725.1 transporter [Chitinophagaceae bacterium]